MNSEGFQTRLAEQEIAGITLQPLVKSIKSATYPRQDQAAVLRVCLNLLNKDLSWWDFFSASSTELLQIPAAQNAGIGLLNLLGIEGMYYTKAIKTLLDGGLNQSYQPADLLNLLHKDISRGINGSFKDSGLIQLVGLFLNIDLDSLSNLKGSLTAIKKQTSWKGYLVAVIEALKAIPAVQVRLGRLTQFADWVIWLFDGLAPIYRLWRTWKDNNEREMRALINEMKQSSNGLLSGIGHLSPWLPLLEQMQKAGVGLPPLGAGNIELWLESVTRLLLTHSSLEHLRGKAENIAGEWVGERMVQIFTAALDQTLQQQPLLINTTPVTQAVRTAMQWAIDLYPLVESQISGMLLQPPGSQKKPPKLSSLLPAMYFVPPEEKVANAQMMFPVSQDLDEEYQGEDTDWAWWTKTFGIASLLLFAGSATASRLANSRDNKRGTSDIENPMELQPLENKQPQFERVEQQPEQVERLPKVVNKANKWAWGLGLLGGVSAVAAIGSGMMWYYSSPPIEETEEYFYTDDIQTLLEMLEDEQDELTEQGNVQNDMPLEADNDPAKGERAKRAVANSASVRANDSLIGEGAVERLKANLYKGLQSINSKQIFDKVFNACLSKAKVSRLYDKRRLYIELDVKLGIVSNREKSGAIKIELNSAREFLVSKLKNDPSKYTQYYLEIRSSTPRAAYNIKEMEILNDAIRIINYPGVKELLVIKNSPELSKDSNLSKETKDMLSLFNSVDNDIYNYRMNKNSFSSLPINEYKSVRNKYNQEINQLLNGELTKNRAEILNGLKDKILKVWYLDILKNKKADNPSEPKINKLKKLIGIRRNSTQFNIDEFYAFFIEYYSNEISGRPQRATYAQSVYSPGVKIANDLLSPERHLQEKNGVTNFTKPEEQALSVIKAKLTESEAARNMLIDTQRNKNSLRKEIFNLQVAEAYMQTLLSQQKSYQEVFDQVTKVEYVSESENVRDHFSAGERLANEKFSADKNRRNLYIAAYVQKAIGGLPKRRALDLLSITYVLKKINANSDKNEVNDLSKSIFGFKRSSYFSSNTEYYDQFVDYKRIHVYSEARDLSERIIDKDKVLLQKNQVKAVYPYSLHTRKFVPGGFNSSISELVLDYDKPIGQLTFIHFKDGRWGLFSTLGANPVFKILSEGSPLKPRAKELRNRKSFNRSSGFIEVLKSELWAGDNLIKPPEALPIPNSGGYRMTEFEFRFDSELAKVEDIATLPERQMKKILVEITDIHREAKYDKSWWEYITAFIPLVNILYRLYNDKDYSPSFEDVFTDIIDTIIFLLTIGFPIAKMTSATAKLAVNAVKSAKMMSPTSRAFISNATKNITKVFPEIARETTKVSKFVLKETVSFLNPIPFADELALAAVKRARADFKLRRHRDFDSSKNLAGFDITARADNNELIDKALDISLDYRSGGRKVEGEVPEQRVQIAKAILGTEDLVLNEGGEIIAYGKADVNEIRDSDIRTLAGAKYQQIENAVNELNVDIPVLSQKLTRKDPAIREKLSELTSLELDSPAYEKYYERIKMDVGALRMRMRKIKGGLDDIWLVKSDSNGESFYSDPKKRMFIKYDTDVDSKLLLIHEGSHLQRDTNDIFYIDATQRADKNLLTDFKNAIEGKSGKLTTEGKAYLVNRIAYNAKKTRTGIKFETTTSEFDGINQVFQGKLPDDNVLDEEVFGGIFNAMSRDEKIRALIYIEKHVLDNPALQVKIMKDNADSIAHTILALLK